jgi:hypothetical protein
MESPRNRHIQLTSHESVIDRRRPDSRTAIELTNIAADEYWQEFHVELARVSLWLKRRLRGKEVRIATLLKEAKEKEMSPATVRRAFLLLGGLSQKENKKNGQWFWQLPAPSTPAK